MKAMSRYILFLALVYIVSLSGSVVCQDELPSVADVGYCADVGLVHNFDVDQFLGTWYLQLEVPNAFAEAGQCTALNFSEAGSGMVMSSEAWSYQNKRISQKIVLSRRMRNETTPYYVMIKENTPQVEYSIAATDYLSYACTYTCFQIIGALRVELFFVATREQNPPDSVFANCDVFFEDNYIDSSKLRKVDQTSDVCGAQWREDNLLLVEDNKNATYTDKGEERHKDLHDEFREPEPEYDSDLLSVEEKFGTAAENTISNGSYALSEDTNLMISLLENEASDSSNKGPASGSTARHIFGGARLPLVCLFLTCVAQKVAKRFSLA